MFQGVYSSSGLQIFEDIRKGSRRYSSPEDGIYVLKHVASCRNLQNNIRCMGESLCFSKEHTQHDETLLMR
jgi:hypothetical protein